MYGQTTPEVASLLLLRSEKLRLSIKSEEEFVDFQHTSGVGKITNNEGRRPVRDHEGVSTLVELFGLKHV